MVVLVSKEQLINQSLYRFLGNLNDEPDDANATILCIQSHFNKFIYLFV